MKLKRNQMSGYQKKILMKKIQEFGVEARCKKIIKKLKRVNPKII